MTAPRRNARRQRGVTMVEFALVFPVAALLLFGIVVLGIVVSNQLQLNTAVRNSARAAAICGSGTVSGPGSIIPPGQYNSTPTLPNGQPCTNANVSQYVNQEFNSVGSGLVGTMTVYDTAGNPVTTGTAPENCSVGYTMEVTVNYSQPLYLPMLGYVLGDGATDTRTITATGEATCEQ